MQSEHKTFHKPCKPLYVNFSLLALLQSETAKSFSFARWPFFFIFTEQRMTSESLPAGKVTVGGGEEALRPRSSPNRARLAVTLVGGGPQPLDRGGRRWARACASRPTVRLGRPVASGRRRRGATQHGKEQGGQADVEMEGGCSGCGTLCLVGQPWRHERTGQRARWRERVERAGPQEQGSASVFPSDEPGRGGGHAGQYEGHAAAAPAYGRPRTFPCARSKICH
jgi:hypothetical protein